MRSHNSRLLPSFVQTARNKTAQLLRLVDQKRQHHHHGKHHGEMLLAMAVVVLKVIALIFQDIARLIFHLPPSTSTSHQAINSALAHPQVCYPAKVLGLTIAYFPILSECSTA